MAFNKIDESSIAVSSTTDNAEIIATTEIDSQPKEQQLINASTQAREVLEGEIMDKAIRLKSYIKIDALPKLIHQAFEAIARDLVLTTANGTLEQLEAVPDIDRLTDRIFEVIKQEQQQEINEKATAKSNELTKPAPVEDAKGNLFSRNWLSLGVLATTTLIAIGLTLLASGIFAPLGIVLTGAAFIATLAGVASAAALAIGLGVKIGHDEWQRRQQLLADKQSYDELNNQYNDQLRLIDEEKNSELAALNNSMARYRQLVAEHPQESLYDEPLADVEQSFNEEFSLDDNELNSDDEEFFSCDEGSDTESNTEEDHVDAEPPPADQCPLAFLKQELTNANEHMQQADSIDVTIPKPEPKSQNIEDSDARCLNYK